MGWAEMAEVAEVAIVAEAVVVIYCPPCNETPSTNFNHRDGCGGSGEGGELVMAEALMPVVAVALVVCTAAAVMVATGGGKR